ncbi:MAG: hypothetical protein JWR90_2150 [Marmoricola sp.]|jgi:hypothetical protein|nr:hypothetical protein [Marmoricola sp.]
MPASSRPSIAAPVPAVTELPPLLLLPWRLASAGVTVTLAAGAFLAPDGPLRRRDGYADQLAALLGENGMIGKLDAMSRDPESPLGRLAALAQAADPRRPLGRAIARGGILDRVLSEDGPLARLLSDGGAADRLLAPDGPLDRLLASGGVLDRLLVENGPLERLVDTDGALDRITRPGGALDIVLQKDGLLDRLLEERGFVEKLVADGGTLDQLVALGPILEQVHPRLLELVGTLPELRASIEVLGESVGPLADLANRIPGRRK